MKGGYFPDFVQLWHIFDSPDSCRMPTADSMKHPRLSVYIHMYRGPHTAVEVSYICQHLCDGCRCYDITWDERT